MPSKYEIFAALHVPGDPVVLYNIWDAGSARAVAAAGAKALATGSHPVGDASGFGDGQMVPLDFVFANAGRIMAAVDLPLTVDFEGGYAVDPGLTAANVAALAATGAAETPRSQASIEMRVRRASTSSRCSAPSCDAAYTTSAAR